MGYYGDIRALLDGRAGMYLNVITVEIDSRACFNYNIPLWLTIRNICANFYDFSYICFSSCYCLILDVNICWNCTLINIRSFVII